MFQKSVQQKNTLLYMNLKCRQKVTRTIFYMLLILTADIRETVFLKQMQVLLQTQWTLWV